VILAVMAERLFGFGVSRRQWLGVGMTAAGPGAARRDPSGAERLAFLVFRGGHGRLRGRPARPRRPAHLRARASARPIITTASCSAARRGLLFGVSDVAIKALTGLGGVLAVLVSPWLLIAIVASIIAFYASARGLQEGEAVPVIAATSTAANVSCIAGGIIVFGDPMPADALGIVVQVCAFIQWSASRVLRRRRSAPPANAPRYARLTLALRHPGAAGVRRPVPRSCRKPLRYVVRPSTSPNGYEARGARGSEARCSRCGSW
jgi:hypothetical protein